MKATTLLVGQHREKEEELFPKVEKKLGKERLEELGTRMQTRFDEVVKAGFAASVPKGLAKTRADATLHRL